jgi:hypothetical protein
VETAKAATVHHAHRAPEPVAHVQAVHVRATRHSLLSRACAAKAELADHAHHVMVALQVAVHAHRAQADRVPAVHAHHAMVALQAAVHAHRVPADSVQPVPARAVHAQQAREHLVQQALAQVAHVRVPQQAAQPHA